MSDDVREMGGIRRLWLSPRVQFYKPEIFATAALVALVLFLSLYPKTTESFINTGNFMNVTRQVSMNGIIACGMTFAILMGGIDLSVGSVVAVAGMIAGDCMMRVGLSVPVSIIIAILGGSLFGVFNGVIAAYTNVPPFIATLGSMSIARGLALLFRAGYAISDLPETFNILGQGQIFAIPYATIILVVMILFSWFLLHKTIFGRCVFALGWSRETLRLSGINIKWVKVRIFTFVGFCSALAGVLMASRVGSAQPMVGAGWEMDAIAAVVIGGGNIAGGRATMVGTIIGAFLLGFLSNGLNLMGVSPYLQNIFKGIVILVAVFLRSGWSEKR
ncbi:sugar ABC transporter permease [Synergistales bacterium]|nr:sugar ABC transporter permease [Synergistales bacterium]